MPASGEAGSSQSYWARPSHGKPPMLALVDDGQSSRLIKQGAEAKVYVSTLFPVATLMTLKGVETGSAQPANVAPTPALIKHRFPKTYRHPSLSRHLTASRTVAEGRALLRCARAGVHTPRVLCVDEEHGVLGLELIDGFSVRELLGGGSEGDEVDNGSSEEGGQGEEALARQELAHVPAVSAPSPPLLENDEALHVMRLIGTQLARMHQAHVIHGDLTTSNMMLRRTSRGPDVVLIDFGLSSNSTWPEDKAVDLYVLERAFSSTHARSEHLFHEILLSYQHTLETSPAAQSKDNRQQHQQSSRQRGAKGEKGASMSGATNWKDIKRKIDDVRLRGRKRSMVG